jgi:hypothetical protein
MIIVCFGKSNKIHIENIIRKYIWKIKK